jgi:glycosyltransferase involved in cell wall biosynthesis
VLLGIDGTNLRRGGGRTHLIELLGAATPKSEGVDRVLIWASQDTLAQIEDRDWLIKRNPSALNGGLLRRSLWQRFSLSRAARSEQCDILFVPGGSYAGNFHPIVTMSRNMLPFEWRELSRYGWTLTTLKLLLLRWTQARSFRRADGVVFLTQYAREAVQRVTGELKGAVTVIPHGLNARFIQHRKDVSEVKKLRDSGYNVKVLYVSHVEPYKHQWNVIEAIAKLRDSGYRIRLDLVGAPGNAVSKLNLAMKTHDPLGDWVVFHGGVAFFELHKFYANCDIGLFASSCENMPNTLLELMGAGIPIACSKMGPMPDILKDGGVYFDPEKPASIAASVQELVDSGELSKGLCRRALEIAEDYTWESTAQQTLTFIANIARDYLK